MSFQIVSEGNTGVYLWKMPNGKYIADDDARFLSIDSVRGDVKKIEALTNFVKYELGIEEGAPFFMEGNRKVTDEEYEEQVARAKLGLVPDPMDINAIRDEMPRGR